MFLSAILDAVMRNGIGNARKGRFHAGFLHLIPDVLDVLDSGVSEMGRWGKRPILPRPRLPTAFVNPIRNLDYPDRLQLSADEIGTSLFPDATPTISGADQRAGGRSDPVALGLGSRVAALVGHGPLKKASALLVQQALSAPRAPRNARVVGLSTRRTVPPAAQLDVVCQKPADIRPFPAAHSAAHAGGRHGPL